MTLEVNCSGLHGRSVLVKIGILIFEEFPVHEK